MTILLIAAILGMTAIFHFTPDWTRPDIFFTVTVAPDTVIEPFVQLLGATRIGSDCRIRCTRDTTGAT